MAEEYESRIFNGEKYYWDSSDWHLEGKVKLQRTARELRKFGVSTRITQKGSLYSLWVKG